MLNMVLPLSAFGVYCGSADAGTVAGIVTIQNTAKPSNRAGHDDGRKIAQRQMLSHI